MTEALNGRSETESGTEQVGSCLNGRRRSEAWFQQRPLSALYRLGFHLAAICLVGFRVPAGKPASQSAGVESNADAL